MLRTSDLVSMELRTHRILVFGREDDLLGLCSPGEVCGTQQRRTENRLLEGNGGCAGVIACSEEQDAMRNVCQIGWPSLLQTGTDRRFLN